MKGLQYILNEEGVERGFGGVVTVLELVNGVNEGF